MGVCKLSIAVVTTSRADYGLLYPLIKKIQYDDYFKLDLIVTGSHLSDLHGKTINAIKENGFDVQYAIEMTAEGDTENDICNSIAAGLKGFSKLYMDIAPDLVLVLGDRYELLSACIAAVIHKIPIAHIHGGEVTEGAVDDCIRHSITKMAAIHFPSIEPYGKRIIQMGEDPTRVHIVGALGIDNIKNIELMDIYELSEYTGVDFSKDVALITYHPVTTDNYKDAYEQIRLILDALLHSDLFSVVSAPNADTAYNSIYKVIMDYTGAYPHKFKLIKNLGQRAYLSSMKYAKVMVGNSSSGIIESASFRIPVVNIGDRQKGRLKPQNVIDTQCDPSSICASINAALSKDFKNSIFKLKNPYGDGNTANRIINILKTIDIKNKQAFLKKSFFDIGFKMPNVLHEDELI